MRLKSKWLGIGLVALLLLSVTGAAMAQEPAQPPSGPAVRGRIEAKSQSGFTLSTKRGELAVSVDAGTRYRMPGVEQPTLADLQVGDTVLVLGRRNEAGEFLARWVALLPPVPVGALKGEITAIEGQTLTVATGAGEKALLTDENTQFRVPDVEQPTLADIHVGDRVFVLVEAQEGGTLLARRVAVLPEDSRGPVSLRGRVIEVAESSLKVQARQGEVTVVATEATHIRVPGVENPTLADIRVGDTVLVVGRPTGLCQVEARAIGALPPVSAHKFAIPGEVLSIEGTTLTVQDPRDTHTIFTDEQTRFRVPGVEDASIADVEVGDHILAIGQPAEDNALLARWIIVRRPQQQPGAEKPPAEGPSVPIPF